MVALRTMHYAVLPERGEFVKRFGEVTDVFQIVLNPTEERALGGFKLNGERYDNPSVLYDHMEEIVLAEPTTMRQRVDWEVGMETVRAILFLFGWVWR